MNNLFKKITYILLLSVALFAAGCGDDIDDEITSLDTSRLFSPTDLNVRVINITSAILTWNKANKADSYNIEVYNNESFDGTLLRSATDVTETTYTFTEFEGDTQYWVRVQAVASDEGDSKWTEGSFTTGIKSELLSVQIGDITAEEFIIRWNVGVNATRVVLTPSSGSRVEHAITADEVTAGVATITGLTPSTKYSVVLYNGAQRIGLYEFTTLKEGTVFIYPEDDIVAKIDELAVEDGAFMIMPGTYSVGTLNITKSITIQGASADDKPILSGTIVRPSDGAGLALKDLVLNGTGSPNGDQTLVYAAGTFGALSIDGCEIRNYTKGAMYVNNATKIASVSITNCLYHDIECNGGDFIDFRNGLAETFTFKNNTVYNSALARDLFRMDAGGSTNFPGIRSIITIENNTFHKVCDGTSRRILYIRLASNDIYFNNNILANTAGYYTNQAATNIVGMNRNNYHSAPNFTASTQTNAKNDTGNYTTLDPQFEDPANGNFTINNLTLTVGDPRWIK